MKIFYIILWVVLLAAVGLFIFNIATAKSADPSPIVELGAKNVETMVADQNGYLKEYVTTAKRELFTNIYLTFDDGPSNNTLAILDILDKYDVKATFFVLGPRSDYRDGIIKQCADKGHGIAIHSYTHKYGEIYATDQAYRQDVTRVQDWLAQVIGQKVMVFRFPGGSIGAKNRLPNGSTIIADLLADGFSYFDWHIDSQDSISTSVTTEHIQGQVLGEYARLKERGSKNMIILFHDSSTKANTVAALEPILAQMVADGCSFEIVTSDTPAVRHYKP